MTKERVGIFWALRVCFFPSPYHMCPKCDSQAWYVGKFGENERPAIAFTCGFRVFVHLTPILCILALFLSLIFFG